MKVRHASWPRLPASPRCCCCALCCSCSRALGTGLWAAGSALQAAPASMLVCELRIGACPLGRASLTVLGLSSRQASSMPECFRDPEIS